MEKSNNRKILVIGILLIFILFLFFLQLNIFEIHNEIESIIEPFEGHGGYAYEKVTFRSDSKIRLNSEPVKNGYHFKIMDKVIEFKTKFNFTEEVITENTIRYNKWQRNEIPIKK